MDLGRRDMRSSSSRCRVFAHMAVSINLGVLLLGVFVLRALLFGVCIQGPRFLQTHKYTPCAPVNTGLQDSRGARRGGEAKSCIH